MTGQKDNWFQALLADIVPDTEKDPTQCQYCMCDGIADVVAPEHTIVNEPPCNICTENEGKQ